MFLGEDCPAVDAERIGLVNRLVRGRCSRRHRRRPGHQFLTLPTKAISLTKRLANRSFESSREQSFDDEALFQDLVSTTDDMREGMAAFVERRPPAFKGW